MSSYNLKQYQATIDAFDATRPDMRPVRAYNHQMIDIFNSLRPLAGACLLDIGASPHGYALEHALERGVSRYIGIGLGVPENIEVHAKRGVGTLLRMNAEQLSLAPDTVNFILTLSTFEHFLDGAAVLREMHRVLRPGGSVLANFQPIWTCSEGHHLHHIEPLTKLVPPWSHLLLTEDAMRRQLAPLWSPQLPMTLDETIHWIYRSSEINRVDITRQREIFQGSNFQIEWMTPLLDDDSDKKSTIAAYLSRLLPYTATDLMTRGFSLLLNKR